MNFQSKIAILVTLVFCVFIYLFWHGTSDNFNIFYQKLSTLCWVAYAPTNFNPMENKNIYPSENSIKEDLTVLQKAGFNGIVTFGSEKSLGQIPKIANKLGYKGIIMGIWKPDSSEEFHLAVAAEKYVDAYCIGHMGLNKRYGLKILHQTISKLSETTGKPISISESMQLYQKGSELIDIGDWLFPDAHLYWDTTGTRTPKRLFIKLVEDYERLAGISKKPVLIKTVGFPTEKAHGATEDNQTEFFRLILDNAKHPSERIRLVYFEAFDQPWKTWHPIEAHWGIFKSDRAPKAGSSNIWGGSIPPIDPQPIPLIENRNYYTYILLGMFPIIIIPFLLWIRKEYKENTARKKHEEGAIKLLLTEKKEIIRINNGIEKKLHFKNSHNDCFNILLLLIKNEKRPMSCGEIIHAVKDTTLLPGCSFDSEKGECEEQKKQYCTPYGTLNTHRISVIRKKLEENEIGTIENIKRQSKWKLVLNPEVRPTI